MDSVTASPEQPLATTAAAPEPDSIINIPIPAPEPVLDPEKELIFEQLQDVNESLDAVEKLKTRVASIDPDTKDPADIKLRNNWKSFAASRKEYTDALISQKAYLELKRDDLLVPDKSVVLPVEIKTDIAEKAIRHLTKKHEWDTRHTRIYLSAPDEFSGKLIKRFSGSDFPVEAPPRLGMANSLKASIGDINSIKRNRIFIQIIVDKMSHVGGTHNLIFKKDGDQWVVELAALPK